MDFQEFIKLIFGDSVAFTDVLSIIATILWPILTIFYNKAKTKLIVANRDSAIKDEKILAQEKKINELEKGFSYLANIITSAYISSNTISPETKKQIAFYASKLDTIAQIDLSENTKKLIEQASVFVPNINDKKEEILKATDEAEKIIDEVNDATKAALDKLEI